MVAVKKYFKTYYSLPDKSDKVDIVFEKGYREIIVLFNGKEVGKFATIKEILKSKEIVATEDNLIHLAFLPETTEFEVFLNGIQIDNSETSPRRVIDNLKWPIYFALIWYTMVLLITHFRTYFIDYIFLHPSNLIFDPGTIYTVTSSLLVVIIFVIGLIHLKTGSLLLYYLCLIVICADAVFGAVAILFLFNLPFISGKIMFLFMLILPLVFKSAAIRGFISNISKYKQFVHQLSLMKRKVNNELVDL